MIVRTAAVARSAASATTDRRRPRRAIRIQHVIEIRLRRADRTEISAALTIYIAPVDRCVPAGDRISMPRSQSARNRNVHAVQPRVSAWNGSATILSRILQIVPAIDRADACAISAPIACNDRIFQLNMLLRFFSASQNSEVRRDAARISGDRSVDKTSASPQERRAVRRPVPYQLNHRATTEYGRKYGRPNHSGISRRDLGAPKF